MKTTRTALPWTIEDIDWSRLDRDTARADDLVYYLVAAGSLIETGADLYSDTLRGHFSDPAVRRWLEQHWQPEELQHGRALRRYVEVVWPELDWQRAFAEFFAEYAPLCKSERQEQRPALELAARCVVEMGTSTFYTALQRRAAEPVLQEIAGRISDDEVRHYRHFRDFFDAQRRGAGIGRVAVLGALWRRAATTQNEDASLAFKHAWRLRHPGGRFHDALFDRFRIELRAMMRRCYPYRMAVLMMLRPLELNRALVGLSLPILESAARRFMFA